MKTSVQRCYMPTDPKERPRSVELNKNRHHSAGQKYMIETNWMKRSSWESNVLKHWGIWKNSDSSSIPTVTAVVARSASIFYDVDCENKQI